MAKHSLVPVLSSLLLIGCGADVPHSRNGWTGTIDTLPSGHIIVRNGDRPIWSEGTGWRVEVVLRIGSVEGGVPEAFGSIKAFDVDAAGRIWVLDGLAQKLKVFDESGAHLKTIGRQGAGPGEFKMPVDVDIAPDGRVWVVDIGNYRMSSFDTTGQFLGGRQIPTHVKMRPWLGGGFDEQGRFYMHVLTTPLEWEQAVTTLVRHDSAFAVIDTLERPVNPTPPEVVDYKGYTMPIPFQGVLRRQRTRRGTIRALVTDEYRLFELTWSGDTLRTITRASAPVPVTENDMEQLRHSWAREIERLGALPRWWSRIPESRPPVTGLFFENDDGNLWVELQPEAIADSVRVFDVFDPEGRYLGPVPMPFVLGTNANPVVRNGFLYGVTRDELDVPYIVKARLIRRTDG